MYQELKIKVENVSCSSNKKHLYGGAYGGLNLKLFFTAGISFLIDVDQILDTQAYKTTDDNGENIDDPPDNNGLSGKTE